MENSIAKIHSELICDWSPRNLPLHQMKLHMAQTNYIGGKLLAGMNEQITATNAPQKCMVEV